jgi:hypothetical protein
MLDVQTLCVTGVGDGHDLLGVAVFLAALVDLQLHPKEAGAGAVEDGCGLVIVALDALAGGMGLETGLAVTLIIAVVQIMKIVIVDQPPALAAEGVVVPAVPAETEVAAAEVIVSPDELFAVVTENGKLVQTYRAEFQTIEGKSI